ncbi:thioesterase II family protein [Rhizobacter sp. OV335]|uniref:thioesterase II family protein n=1 Tax=Rhizobacter sp. OV335 TaxID=1500264 RepID=UPI00092238E4|nr:alpha/beta fold hydrolase [Rhizobacter sp. OV335]SHN31663.1 Surfactin synthase thioesterase subunit [Rhizobacter sp. OV335]
MIAPSIRLLCLPCAGASATMYLRWRRLLPSWVQVVPVELPGRGARLGEPCVESFAALVSRLCDEQAAAMTASAGSVMLFGHSMGGLLAWGIARHLRERGLPAPAALFVSGCPAPGQRDPQRFANKDTDHQLIADLRRQGGTPDEVFASPEMLRITLDALRADYRVCTSVPELPPARPLDLPIHAFGGRHDDIDAARLAAWRREARTLFSLTWLDGGHFFIRQSEPQLLAALVHEMQPLRLEPLPS